MTQPFRVLCYLAFLAISFEIVMIITRLKSNDETTSAHHLIAAFVALFAELYVVLVIDSLHKKFRDEKFLHNGFVYSC
jgi:hypothetical protein